MHPSTWLRYLFGQGSAIREVAESRSAMWLGVGFVLLTAIARSYDQTFIGEKPLLWLFGPLLFSVVSGSWLYVVAYGWLARWRMEDLGEGKPAFYSGWRGFMGLFWMTAPVAWLYAIPVERFCDPVAAAKANVALLAVVSLWRVLLMTRVLQCLTRAPFFVAVFWVLFAAAVEVLVVFFFGGAFARAVMRGMGGMRNSPAEEVLFGAMGTAFVGAFWTAPAAFVLALILKPKQPTIPLPPLNHDRLAWRLLIAAAVFWVGVAVWPQIQLRRNLTVENLFAQGRTREALDFLGQHQPGQFAPARALPPKPFERSVFEELPACFDALALSDPVWVRIFLLQCLNETMVHYGPRWGRDSNSPEQRVETMQAGLSLYHREPHGLLKLLNGLTRIPEGQAWLATNRIFLEAMQRVANDGAIQNRPKPESSAANDWLSLSNRVQGLLLQAGPFAVTNQITPQPAAGN